MAFILIFQFQNGQVQQTFVSYTYGYGPALYIVGIISVAKIIQLMIYPNGVGVAQLTSLFNYMSI